MKTTFSWTTPHTSQQHDHLELEQSNIQFYVVHWPTDKLKVSRSAVVHNQLCVAMNTVEHFREMCVGARDVHVCNSERNIIHTFGLDTGEHHQNLSPETRCAHVCNSEHNIRLHTFGMGTGEHHQDLSPETCDAHVCNSEHNITHLRDGFRRTPPGPEPWNTWRSHVH